MNQALLNSRALKGRLELTRFVEPVWVLLAPTAWEPESKDSTLPKVVVPRGFVTDLISVPRIFWSAVRPDGEAAHAAVIHDYLYWNQTTDRSVADMVFGLAMRDLAIKGITRNALLAAVVRYGDTAWKQNAKLRKRGESRLLAKLPDSATERWSDWRSRPDVFSR